MQMALASDRRESMELLGADGSRKLTTQTSRWCCDQPFFHIARLSPPLNTAELFLKKLLDLIRINAICFFFCSKSNSMNSSSVQI